MTLMSIKFREKRRIPDNDVWKCLNDLENEKEYQFGVIS